jgi:CRISP-associated protein Cas1
MSHHIVHLLSHNLKVRMRLDQLHVLDRITNVEKTVPLRDIAIIICAAPDTSFTSAALRRATELGVLILLCDEKFQPACLTIPYYQPTTSDLPKLQASWPARWKAAQWQAVITAKVENQATVLAPLNAKVTAVLREISAKCQAQPFEDVAAFRPGKLLASITASQRDSFRSWSANACESRAARLYWHCLLPKLDPTANAIKTRQPGTRQGINGMLDYGYAVLRTAVLRSLAAHGFMAALGINHTTKPGSQPLADDLMEPLRPFCDRALLDFMECRNPSESHEARMKAWIPKASAVLTETLLIRGAKVRVLNAIDLYVQSFANACYRTQALVLPRLPPR